CGKVEEHDGGQFLELSGDVYYLLGKDEQGSDISTLFICECYHHLSNIIFENENICRWHITVVYYRLDKSLILFSEKGAFNHIKDNIHAFKDYLANEEKRHYSSFDKLGTTTRYMPVWSWEEINACRIKFFHNLTQGHQNLLQSVINSVNDNLLNFVGETTVDNSASYKIVHICTNISKGENGEEGDESVGDMEITEVENNPGEPSTSQSFAVTRSVTRPDKRKSVIGNSDPFYSMSTLEFAFDYVSKEVMNKLIKNYRDQLENFIKASLSISDYSTLQGTIFEQIAHRKLLKGGSFNACPLFASTVFCFGMYNSKLSTPTQNKRLFSNISEIVCNKYCIPTQKNNTSFDVLILPKHSSR
ncbi:18432_t:CDS:2, partial [Acaulospora morrowiae]